MFIPYTDTAERVFNSRISDKKVEDQVHEKCSSLHGFDISGIQVMYGRSIGDQVVSPILVMGMSNVRNWTIYL